MNRCVTRLILSLEMPLFAKCKSHTAPGLNIDNLFSIPRKNKNNTFFRKNYCYNFISKSFSKRKKKNLETVKSQTEKYILLTKHTNMLR